MRWRSVADRFLLPAVRCRHAPVSCECMARGACRYNTAFASCARGDAGGRGRSGATENVFPLQLADGGGDGGAIAVFPRAGAAQEKILGEFARAVRAAAAGGGIARGGRPGAIWIHAVSVGEVLAARPLALRLQREVSRAANICFDYHCYRAGLARERMKFTDGVFYFPFDWTWWCAGAAGDPAVDRVILETEIWPNFLRSCGGENVPAIFVNARISEKSFGRFRLAGR